ncbi:unnamed protein product [Calicophoron daubneyi]|uniref:AAA+ ATPase domain-containing protein n=1 Tax=Calicophoron daubneyi TaxID=300641 RepID=A0AAV2U0W7_CALDB
MNAAKNSANILLITGKPGTGKTTLISRVFELLSQRTDVSSNGFITEEVRENHRRIGFDIVLLGSATSVARRAPLARCVGYGVNSRGPRVGQYVVDLPSFEGLAIPCIQSVLNGVGNQRPEGDRKKLTVCIIDEIGKMELSSSNFTKHIQQLINKVSSSGCLNTVLLATVPSSRRPDGLRGIRLVDDLCSRPDVSLFEVSFSNRDSLVKQVYDATIGHMAH